MKANPNETAAERVRCLIVAVHGIGDQYHSATIQPVARQVTGFCGLPIGLPFGAFHLKPGLMEAYPYSAPRPYDKTIGEVGFAEVFWADIHREAAATEDTIQEETSWAKTVVERLREIDQAGDVKVAPGGMERAGLSAGRLVKRLRAWLPDSNAEWKHDSLSNDVDYRKTAAVMEEMIETIATIENFMSLAAKAGWFDFNLNTILTDYIGTVQVVAEFNDYRERIIARFRTTMKGLLHNHPNTEDIHIIAHSEGTVVALKVLMEVLSRGASEDMLWISKVKGLMTFGSPLNKHFVMWPALWEGLTPPEDCKLERAIVWHNYYDHGDPVGFDLGISREWLEDHGWISANGKGGVFDFDESKDHGFTRYPLPGEAHNDYFDDAAVFGHYISHAVMDPPRADFPAPRTRWWAVVISLTVPYLLCFGLLAAGLYLLYKPVSTGVRPEETGTEMAWSVAGLTVLLSGITILSRIPRLVKIGRWHLLAALLFIFGLFAYYHWVDEEAQTLITGAFETLGMGAYAVVWVALIISLVSSLMSKLWPKWGMIPLISMGTIAALIVVGNAYPNLSGNPPLWPIVLGALAFAILWRLGALLFDMAFVWHRYICDNGAMDVLDKLRREAKPPKGGKEAVMPEN